MKFQIVQTNPISLMNIKNSNEEADNFIQGGRITGKTLAEMLLTNL